MFNSHRWAGQPNFGILHLKIQIDLRKTFNKFHPSAGPVQWEQCYKRGGGGVWRCVCASSVTHPPRPPSRERDRLYTRPQPRPTPSRHMCLHSNTPNARLRVSLKLPITEGDEGALKVYVVGVTGYLFIQRLLNAHRFCTHSKCSKSHHFWHVKEDECGFLETTNRWQTGKLRFWLQANALHRTDAA